MSRGASRAPLLACLLSATWSCSGPRTSTTSEPEGGFLVSGCSEWESDGTCEAEEPLNLWVESSTAAVPNVEVAGYEVGPAVRVLGGYRFILKPTSTVGLALRTSIVVDQRARLGVWRRPPKPQEAPDLLASRTSEELLDLLPNLSPPARLTLLARSDVRLAPAPGAPRDRLIQQATLLAEALGRRMQRNVFRFSAAHSRLRQGDLTGSEAELEAGPPPDPRDGLAQAWMAYARAQLARQRMDTTEAIRRSMELRILGERLGHPYSIWIANQVALPLLRQGGYVERARQVEADLLDSLDNLDCRQRGSTLTNIGWSRVMAREASLGQAARVVVVAEPDETTSLLERAQAEYGRCDGGLYNGALNLLLDAIQRGDLERARKWQAIAHGIPSTPRLLAWDQLLDARLRLLAKSPGSAEDRFATLTQEPGVEPRVLVEALLGLALARVLQDKTTEAEAAIGAAADALGGLPRGSADGIDAEAHSSRVMWWARIALDLYARTGQAEQAFGAARQAQLWLASTTGNGTYDQLSPEARGRRDTELQRFYAHRAAAASKRAVLWAAPGPEKAMLAREVDEEERLAASALNAALQDSEVRGHLENRPPRGGVQILIHPGLDRWWAILRDNQHTLAWSVPARQDDLETASEELLSAAPRDLSKYSEIQLVPGGAMREVDLHALPYRGKALALWAPLTYAAPRASSRVTPTPSYALLVGDGRVTLQSMRELDDVSSALLKRGVRVERAGQSALDQAQLARLLAGAQLLHFAGHAERSEEALRTGLRVRDDLWLTVADVLASPKVPTTVVLSGCDTSRDRLQDPGWSMADAFIISGAQEVVGTSRPVAGALALEMMTRFYAVDGPAALALFEAVRGIASDERMLDWPAFRAIVPAGHFTVTGGQRNGTSEATVTSGPAPN